MVSKLALGDIVVMFVLVGGECGGVNLAYISIVHTLACCAAFVFIYMCVFLIPVSCCAISTIDDDNHNKNSQNLS